MVLKIMIYFCVIVFLIRLWNIIESTGFKLADSNVTNQCMGLLSAPFYGYLWMFWSRIIIGSIRHVFYCCFDFQEHLMNVSEVLSSRFVKSISNYIITSIYLANKCYDYVHLIYFLRTIILIFPSIILIFLYFKWNKIQM